MDLCPICIEKPAKNYTECGHSYCIGCLSRIKRCAMCRKSLLRTQLCRDIKMSKSNNMSSYVNFNTRDSTNMTDYIPRFISFTTSSGETGMMFDFDSMLCEAFLDSFEKHLGIVKVSCFRIIRNLDRMKKRGNNLSCFNHGSRGNTIQYITIKFCIVHPAMTTNYFACSGEEEVFFNNRFDKSNITREIITHCNMCFIIGTNVNLRQKGQFVE